MPGLDFSYRLVKPLQLTGYRLNTVLTFSCNRRCWIQGPTAIRCMLDPYNIGRWNETQPKCVSELHFQSENLDVLLLSHICVYHVNIFARTLYFFIMGELNFNENFNNNVCTTSNYININHNRTFLVVISMALKYKQKNRGKMLVF